MPHRDAKRPQGVWEVCARLGAASYRRTRHHTFDAARKAAQILGRVSERVSIRDTRIPLNPFGNLRA
jgi:hypothetical protein